MAAIPKQFVQNQKVNGNWMIFLPEGATWVENGQTHTAPAGGIQLDSAFLTNVTIDGETFDDFSTQPDLTPTEQKLEEFRSTPEFLAQQSASAEQDKLAEQQATQNLQQQQAAREAEQTLFRAREQLLPGEQLVVDTSGNQTNLVAVNATGERRVIESGLSSSLFVNNSQGQATVNAPTSNTSTGTAPKFDNITDDQQTLVDAVYDAIVTNDSKKADQLAEAFKKAEALGDPFWAQQLRVASDALQRGFVSIDKELEFQEAQLQTRLQDLEQDLENRIEFLGLEEQTQLRQIQRQFEQQLETTRNNLAATGFTQSTRREKTEGLLEETAGDLRESTRRRFAAQIEEADTAIERGQRDTQTEIQRLQELASQNKLSLFREAEATLGTGNLPSLSGAPEPLGGLVGEIETNRQKDIINTANSLVF